MDKTSEGTILSSNNRDPEEVVHEVEAVLDTLQDLEALAKMVWLSATAGPTEDHLVRGLAMIRDKAAEAVKRLQSLETTDHVGEDTEDDCPF